MENNFYVYEWIRLDTNEPFYVGKGKGNRCYKLTREKNNHFNNIVNKIPVAVNILHDNLDEQTAFGLEVWYIREYRDIIGYESMCNMNDGGEGCALRGENSPMYGRCGEDSPFYGKHHTEEARKKISEVSKGHTLSEEARKKISEANKGKFVSDETKRKISESMNGENNPNYGKRGKDNHNYGKIHTKETKKLWSEQRRGENNPMYGVHRYGKSNPNAKSVICLTTKKIFYTLKEGAEHYSCNKINISNCCKGKRKSCGKYNGQKLVWRYLVWQHDKRLRVINN